MNTLFLNLKSLLIPIGAITLAQFNAVMGSVAIVGSVILIGVKIYKESKK